MRRILLTGGAGYVGSHAAKTLAQAGHEVIVFDNLSRGHAEFVRWGPLIVGDIRDAEAVDKVLRTYRVEAVMHFAAFAYVGESVREPGIYYDNNIHGMRVLLDAMVRNDVLNIVFSSSCAVYGAPDSFPIDENTPCHPINPYGFTKLACERMLEDYSKAYGMRFVSLRYFNAAGASPEGEIGEWHEPETHLIPLALQALLYENKPLEVFGNDYDTPDGSAIRDFVHVMDLAKGHERALNHLLEKGTSLFVNLGSGKGYSVLEIVQHIEDVVGKRPPLKMAPRRAGDPARLVASCQRAQDVLGWTPEYNIEDIILHAWRWHTCKVGVHKK